MLVAQTGIAVFGQFSARGYGYASIAMTFIYMAAANMGALPIPVMITNEYIKVKERGVVGSINMLFAWGSAFTITIRHFLFYAINSLQRKIFAIFLHLF